MAVVVAPVRAVALKSVRVGKLQIMLAFLNMVGHEEQANLARV